MLHTACHQSHLLAVVHKHGQDEVLGAQDGLAEGAAHGVALAVAVGAAQDVLQLVKK